MFKTRTRSASVVGYKEVVGPLVGDSDKDTRCSLALTSGSRVEGDKSDTDLVVVDTTGVARVGSISAYAQPSKWDTNMESYEKMLTCAGQTCDVRPSCTKVGTLPQAMTAPSAEEDDVVAVRINCKTLHTGRQRRKITGQDIRCVPRPGRGPAYSRQP